MINIIVIMKTNKNQIGTKYGGANPALALLLGCCLLCFLIWIQGCSSQKKPLKYSDSYKNVVVIVGDDHTYKALGAYGNDIVHTPNLDELATQGARFTNAYANSPLCSASRQSLLTGKYPHATGVSLLFSPFNDNTNTTIAEHLKAEGFATALIGKNHFNSFIWWDLYTKGLPKFGFDTLIGRREHLNWLESNPADQVPENIRTFNDPSNLPEKIARMNPETLPQPCYNKDCMGTFLAESAIRFIEENFENRFLLWLAFYEPHAPFTFPVEYADKYKVDDITLPQGSQEDDRWIPERFKGFTDEHKKGIIASYYTSVEFMDKNVGLVINALKENGLYDETLIIYLGDQGYLLYDHKRFEKHTMWKESIKSPLIVGGNKNMAQNKSYDELIEFIDVAPFICEALGVDPMEEAQGRSFYDLLTGSSYQEKDYVVAEFLEDNKAMVANRKWKYIFSTGKRDLGQGFRTGSGPSGITHRLYDLENDPGETTNLANDSIYKDMVSKMQKVMIERFLETHPYAGEIPDNLTIDGKLVWLCEPRDVGAEYGGLPLRTFYANE
jgi:choline-sulfatase